MNLSRAFIILVGIESSVTKIFAQAPCRVNFAFTEDLVRKLLQRLVLFKESQDSASALCASWRVAGLRERSGVRLLHGGCSEVCTGGFAASRCCSASDVFVLTSDQALGRGQAVKLEVFETSNLAMQEVKEMATCKSERWATLGMKSDPEGWSESLRSGKRYENDHSE
jgi:hypothetical protein